MVKKSPESADYRAFPEGSLFAPQSNGSADSDTESPVSLPTLGPKRPLMSEEAERRVEVLETQFSPQQAREKVGGPVLTSEDLERREVRSISQNLSKKPQSPRRAQRSTRGDGVQQPHVAEEIRIPRFRTNAEAEAARQAMKESLDSSTPAETV